MWMWAIGHPHHEVPKLQAQNKKILSKFKIDSRPKVFMPKKSDLDICPDPNFT